MHKSVYLIHFHAQNAEPNKIGKNIYLNNVNQIKQVTFSKITPEIGDEKFICGRRFTGRLVISEQ